MNMKATAYLSLPILLLCASVLANEPGEGPSGESTAPRRGETKVSVFFGTVKAVPVEEVRARALQLLKKEGFVVPEIAECVMNISVRGKGAGCAVMFFDGENQMVYQVVFNGHGQALDVRRGPIRDARPESSDPAPRAPKGGPRAKP